jgi:hypothetical protein
MEIQNTVIDNTTREHLLQLKADLSGFKTVACRFMHEQVTELFDDGGLSPDNLAQLVVRRKGFCNSVLRRKMLGCAHTKANERFAALVDKVYEAGILATDAPPSATVHAISLQIYMMDHEKSRMEKRYALCKHRKDAEGTAVAEKGLNDIQQRHDTVLASLETLRLAVMHALDKALGYSTI